MVNRRDKGKRGDGTSVDYFPSLKIIAQVTQVPLAAVETQKVFDEQLEHVSVAEMLL